MAHWLIIKGSKRPHNSHTDLVLLIVQLLITLKRLLKESSTAVSKYCSNPIKKQIGFPITTNSKMLVSQSCSYFPYSKITLFSECRMVSLTEFTNGRQNDMNNKGGGGGKAADNYIYMYKHFQISLFTSKSAHRSLQSITPIFNWSLQWSMTGKQMSIAVN